MRNLINKVSLFVISMAACLSCFAQYTNPLLSSNNLGDLNSVAAARNNLGLGSSAMINTGTSGATIPLLNGANTWSASQIFNINVTLGQNLILSQVLISSTAPTILSGFGAGASVVRNNDTAAFTINVGTSNTGNGVVRLQTAVNGWACNATDITTTNSNQLLTKQVATTNSSATFQNYTSAGATGPWTDGDILSVACFAY